VLVASAAVVVIISAGVMATVTVVVVVVSTRVVVVLVVVASSPVVVLCIAELDTSDVNSWSDVDIAALLPSVDITTSLVATATDVVSAASEVISLSLLVGAVVLDVVLCAPASIRSVASSDRRDTAVQRLALRPSDLLHHTGF